MANTINTSDDDEDTTPYQTPVNIPVLANDIDPEGDDLTAVDSIVSQPSDGTVSILPDGTVTYTPDLQFTGVDTFVYRVCDSKNQCDDAKVTVTVEPDVPPPTGPIASEFSNQKEFVDLQFEGWTAAASLIVCSFSDHSWYSLISFFTLPLPPQSPFMFVPQLVL